MPLWERDKTKLLDEDKNTYSVLAYLFISLNTTEDYARELLEYWYNGEVPDNE